MIEDLAALNSWNFNIFDYDLNKSNSFAIIMMEEALEPLGVEYEPNILRTFVSRVKHGYRPSNPYHKWEHGLSVMHIAYMMTSAGGVGTYLPPLDKFSVLVASVGHDIGHPGTNNTFEVNKNIYPGASSDLALCYNDQSVLENYHAARTCEIMQDPRSALLTPFEQDQKKDIRRMVILGILGTDMNQHKVMLDSLKDRFAHKKFFRAHTTFTCKLF